ncbi:hypothetical protein BU15DRAFT_67361 [Melanogaster broomeanus]|nr:hypothetical protein BU15DRAFT_67361 [Melanogaster broomeanus]
MARTKQTAKKTTCGEAIRVAIETTALNSMAANLPMINGSTGDSCSLVPLPTQVLNGTRPCFQAMLSASLTQDVQENNNGFYVDGKPILSSFLKVAGRVELSTSSYVHSTPTVILHLRLRSIPPGGPVKMLKEFLRPYFPDVNGLNVFDLEFDLGTVAKRKQYVQLASAMAVKVRQAKAQNVLVTISNHTDEASGDLFLGELRHKNVAATSLCIGNTWSHVIFIGMWLDCSEKESFEALRILLARSVLAFDAERLQPLLTWPFLVQVTEAVFIEGHSVEAAIPNALARSIRLGQHSAQPHARFLTPQVIFGPITTICPWGNNLPLQCPQCGTAQKWSRDKYSKNTYVFRCRFHKCGWATYTEFRETPVSYEFKKTAGVEILEQGKGTQSAWLKESLRPRGCGSGDFMAWRSSGFGSSAHHIKMDI